MQFYLITWSWFRYKTNWFCPTKYLLISGVICLTKSSIRGHWRKRISKYLSTFLRLGFILFSFCFASGLFPFQQPIKWCRQGFRKKILIVILWCLLEICFAYLHWTLKNCVILARSKWRDSSSPRVLIPIPAMANNCHSLILRFSNKDKLKKKYFSMSKSSVFKY